MNQFSIVLLLNVYCISKILTVRIYKSSWILMFSCITKDIIIIKTVFICYKNGSNGKFLKDYAQSENNK